jgi:hypothetical protein
MIEAFLFLAIIFLFKKIQIYICMESSFQLILKVQKTKTVFIRCLQNIYCLSLISVCTIFFELGFMDIIMIYYKHLKITLTGNE